MKQINCQVDVSDYASFQKFYPQCLARFVRNCLKMALRDRSFFQTVYFLDCPEVK